MILGHTSSVGLTAENALADRVVVSEFEVPQDILVSKLSAYVDTEGSSNGDQHLRGVIYSDTGTLLGESAETMVRDLSEPGWVDLVFDSPVRLSADDYAFGIHTGPISNAARWHKTTAGSNLSITTDTYSGGAGSLTPSYSAGELAVYATYAYPWQPPAETDLYLANLGFPSAQTALNTAEADPRTKQRVYASWHGTFLDPQPQGASLAIVQADGVLSDLVGSRVRVSSNTNSTVVYIHREVDLDLDDDTQISLSRRAWLALAPLSEDTLLTTVEVIPGTTE